jgi:hypothetical protein
VALVLEQFQVSERRACKLLGIDRRIYRYQPRPDHNAGAARKVAHLGAAEAALRLSPSAPATGTAWPEDERNTSVLFMP